MTKHGTLSPFFRLLFLSLLLFFGLFFSPILSRGILAGIEVGVRCVLPAVFPFAVLAPYFSDAILSGGGGRRAGLAVLTVGLLCGFPLGAYTAVRCCECGALSEKSAVRLSVFASIPSPSFLIGAVGANMRGNAAHGILLYACCVGSAVICCALFLPKSKSCGARVPILSPLPFSDALSSAFSCGVSLIGFIAFFSGVGAVAAGLLPTSLSLFLLPFLEIGTATSTLAKSSLGPHLSLVLTGFAAGFSGLSVSFQIRAKLREAGLKIPAYYLYKTLQGVICAVGTGLLGWAFP